MKEAFRARVLLSSVVLVGDLVYAMLVYKLFVGGPITGDAEGVLSKCAAFSQVIRVM